MFGKTKRHALVAGGLVVFALSGCQFKNETGHSQVLATVNGEEITFGEVDQYMQKHPLSLTNASDARRAAIDAVIDQHLAETAAKQDGFDARAPVMLDMLYARKMALLDDWGQHLAENAGQPSIEQLRAWYDAHPWLYANRQAWHVARWILRGDSARQQQLARMLSNFSVLDENAARLIKIQWPDMTRVVDVVEPDMLTEARAQALSKMKPWDVLPVHQDSGEIEFWVLESADSQPLGFDDAQALVEHDYALAAQDRSLHHEMADLRATAKIVYLDQPAQ